MSGCNVDADGACRKDFQRTCGRALEAAEAFEREEYILITVGEPVRAVHAREVLQHGLLHRKLHRKTSV